MKKHHFTLKETQNCKLFLYIWLVQHRTRKTLCWACNIASNSCLWEKMSVGFAEHFRLSFCTVRMIFTQWFSGIYLQRPKLPDQCPHMYIYLFHKFLKTISIFFFHLIFFPNLQSFFRDIHHNTYFHSHFPSRALFFFLPFWVRVGDARQNQREAWGALCCDPATTRVTPHWLHTTNENLDTNKKLQEGKEREEIRKGSWMA